MTQGCWGTTGLYAALLRTVNIPVTNEEWDLSSQPHRRPVFPSAGLTVTHADDITAGLMRPSTGSLPPLAAPSSSLFYSLDEYESRFVTPELDCSDDETRCNTEDEQGNYNVERDLLELAYTYRLDGLVMQYVEHDGEYLAVRACVHRVRSSAARTHPSRSSTRPDDVVIARRTALVGHARAPARS
ncbi:MAG: hypothetical protein IT379_31130 [Deltaproteobacteria bacterium]|nr:hypothetical protein [Deltaproteobacteria bacterium]